MNKEGVNRVFEAWIQEALDAGWKRPVVLCLHPALPRSRQVYEEITAGPMPPIPVQAGEDPVNSLFSVTVSLEVACQVVTKHCGPGGEQVARQLADEAIPVKGRVVTLTPEEVWFTGFDGGPTLHGSQSYEHVARRFRTLGEEIRGDEPVRLGLLTDAGCHTHVYGRGGVDAAHSGVLVVAVNSGKMPLEVDGRIVDVPCNDDMLTGMLLKVFSEGDGPQLVAEAVRALRQLPGGKEKRLLRLLRNRPALAVLYRKVLYELTGAGILLDPPNPGQTPVKGQPCSLAATSPGPTQR